MGLNLSERYLTALNVLLIAAIAYMAALSVNDVIASRLASGIRVAPAPNPVALAKEETFQREHYSAIVSRNIFAPPRIDQPAPAPPPIDLHLKLLGTSLQTKEKPWAILLDERTNQQALYRLDDDIPDAGKLVTVEKSRVFIDVQGKRIALEIPANSMPDPGEGPHPAAAASEIFPPGMPFPHGVRHRRGNHFNLKRSVVNGSLSNMVPLLTQMRAQPDPQDKGFKLSEIQPNSLFQQMGLLDGDVVNSINGQQLTDPSQAIGLLNSLRGQDSVRISILRMGRPLQFTYDVH